MSNIKVFTSTGFKDVVDVIANNLKVYHIDNNLNGSLVKVHHWNFAGNTINYKAINNDSRFVMYFNNNHKIYSKINDSVVEVPVDHFVNNLNDDSNVIGHYTISHSQTIGDYKAIKHDVDTNRFNVNFGTVSINDCNTFLYYWKEKYQKYQAIDYKQSESLQAMVTFTGTLSVVDREDGFVVKPYNFTNQSISINKVGYDNEYRITNIPYNKRNNQLHLIYSVDQNTFVL